MAAQFPVGIHCSSSPLSTSSGSDVSEGLTLKHQYLLGIQQAYKPGIGKQKLEASLGWFMCHPKTCVLVEPLDEKSLNNVADGWQMPITTHFQSANKLVFSKGGQYPMWPSTK